MLKILFIVFLCVIGIWVINYLIKNRARVIGFLQDIKTEMKNVSWSTKKELNASTWVVIVSVFLLAVFIGVVDFIISRAINLVIR